MSPFGAASVYAGKGSPAYPGRRGFCRIHADDGRNCGVSAKSRRVNLTISAARNLTFLIRTALLTARRADGDQELVPKDARSDIASRTQTKFLNFFLALALIRAWRPLLLAVSQSSSTSFCSPTLRAQPALPSDFGRFLRKLWCPSLGRMLNPTPPANKCTVRSIFRLTTARAVL
jgi:hypothetical protein